MRLIISTLCFCVFVFSAQADQVEFRSDGCVSVKADSIELGIRFKDRFDKLFPCIVPNKEQGDVSIEVTHKLIATLKTEAKSGYYILLKGYVSKGDKDVGYWEQKSEILYMCERCTPSPSDKNILVDDALAHSLRLGVRVALGII